MSNKSGTTSQVISLPQGGGALQGIGETFSPDLFTGTGNFTVPISLPPGRNDFQPELNLVYSTGNGNGPFGLGWNLSVPGVSRKTSKGIPVYDDAEDTFILSGAEDLVPVESSETQTRYRPRTEGLFARIVHHHDVEIENDYWEVRSKDGLTSLYGTPRDAGRDPATVADPSDRTKVFGWKLTETTDPFGNRIEYEYERDSGEDDQHHWDQLYLKQIRYVDYPDGSETKFLVSVTFHYEDRSRPDPFSEHRAGFEIRTRKRCTHIETHTDADERRLVRTYRLTYLDQREGLEDLLPLNGASLLSQVHVIGHDGERIPEQLPPLEFGYTRFEPRGRGFFPLEGMELPTHSLASPELELADLFGNGLPDILEMNGTVRYWRNLGGGRFDLPKPMRDGPAGVSLADPDVQMLDADGDGRIDLLTSRSGLPGYYSLRFSGEWDRRSFQRYDLAPSFDFADPEVQLVDMDGDGVTDAVRSGSRLEIYFNDPKEGWNDTRRVARRSLDVFPDVNFSDPRVKWADMSGDGLQDIALVYAGNIEYWPNLGYGNWGKRVFMRNSPRFPYGYDPQRILIGDVDGDGQADLVYIDHDRVFLWINQSGNGWSDPIEIDGTPPVTDIDAVRLVDMLGTGVSGVLWTREAMAPGTGGRENHHFLDFTGRLKPYLLHEMDNHMGAITRVEYAPSTRFYLQDDKSHETRWQTPLPFPTQMAARVEVIDAISQGKRTTEYSYHHGYWDGAEREFRGCGRVDQRDTETFDAYHAPSLHPDTAFISIDEKSFSPPVETRTWFHQGPIGDEFGEWEESNYSREFWADDPNRLERSTDITDFLHGLPRRDRRDALRTLRGRILRREHYALDGSERENRPYTVEERVYGVREEEAHAADEDRRCIFFPHTLAERTTQWERGDDPLTQITFTANYDDFGQPRQQTAVGLPRRQAKRRPITGAVVGTLDGDEVNETRILVTHTRTEYAKLDPEAEVYIYDRVAQVRTFELASPGEVVESDPDNLMQVLRDQTDAAQEEVHERFKNLLDDWTPGNPLPETVRLIAHRINHYDGEAFIGLPPGEIGDYGALTRRQALVFTDKELDDAYGDRRPVYLGGPAALPAGAPTELPDDLGYRLESRSAEGYHDGYYADTRRQRFDFQDDAVSGVHGLVTGAEDALEHRTEIKYDDSYRLLPILTRDAVGLETTAEYDYRVLQPKAVTDPNKNTTHVHYSPLGLVENRFLEGREGEGGTEEEPDVTFSYDFLAYRRTRDRSTPTPIYVHSRQRVWHANEAELPAGADLAEIIESREYSDGFGRLLQTRAQAEELAFGETGNDVGLPREPGSAPEPAIGNRVLDRVVVSGWKIYDNKGHVVETYEPFFATGWDFQPEREAKRGQHIEQYYDPRGQNIRTVNPDGSEQRVIFGIPDNLTDPETFAPTPWESYTYDGNDLAPLSIDPVEMLPLTDRAPEAHRFTPASTIRDALGRDICLVERNGSDPEQWFITRQRHDLRDNLLRVVDALDRTKAFQYAYDLLDNRIRNDSIDAGLRTSVLNANGDLIEYRDSKGSLTLHQYDRLNRLARLCARDNTDDPVTLRQKLEYGDASDPDQLETEREASRAYNRLGRLHRHYDEAGLLRFDQYDFKGNVELETREVVSDDAIADGWTADWSAGDAESVLVEPGYQTSARYDALDRPVRITYPQDVEGHRAELTPHYNRAGALERVDLDDEPFVTQIAYNAKGQRVLIAYGNDLMTRYAYDLRTFRLVRLRTERLGETAVSDSWRGRGLPLQDLTYSYDLAGNIETIEDRTPGSGVQDNRDALEIADPELRVMVSRGNALVRRFTYDPLSRLTSATGRECRDIPRPRLLEDGRRCGYDSDNHGTPNQDNAPNHTTVYRECYKYDPAGNMLSLRHSNNGGAWRRRFGLNELPPEKWADANNNQLTTLEQGDDTFSFQYDDNGNMIMQNSERRYSWDHADRLIGFSNEPDSAASASVEARYLYDADGMRVKKWVRTNGTGSGESTVYIGDIFEHHRWQEDGNTKQNNHLHVKDEQQRIALVRRGPAYRNDPGARVQYHLGDHLGSSSIVIGHNGSWINREEYFPYGETSFGSFARKRYRFTGKERDNESGLYYHGARYYAPVIGRWSSVDPAGTVDGLNRYSYVMGNPIQFADPTGMEAEKEEANNTSTITFTEGLHVHVDRGAGQQAEGSTGQPQEYQVTDGVLVLRDQGHASGEGRAFGVSIGEATMERDSPQKSGSSGTLPEAAASTGMMNRLRGWRVAFEILRGTYFGLHPEEGGGGGHLAEATKAEASLRNDLVAKGKKERTGVQEPDPEARGRRRQGAGGSSGQRGGRGGSSGSGDQSRTGRPPQSTRASQAPQKNPKLRKGPGMGGRGLRIRRGGFLRFRPGGIRGGLFGAAGLLAINDTVFFFKGWQEVELAGFDPSDFPEGYEFDPVYEAGYVVTIRVVKNIWGRKRFAIVNVSLVA